MTALRDKSVFSFTQLRMPAVLAAVVSVFCLAAAMSWTSPGILTGVRDQDAQLAAISETAERLQAFTRHIRKASLTTPTETELPFGGFVGLLSHIEPGTRLTLGETGASGHTLEVVSVRKMDRSISLSVAAVRKIELVLVTGRVIGAADAPLVRFLVAVAPKPAAGRADQQSL